ncbi:MAG: UvrD-helicase domain-containing protein [Pontiella sp.]
MNIVYNASAGTGKTYQVTSLFEKLVLEEGIDPREILLMTFTDNAAAELRMRVSHRLLKARRTAEAAGNDERAERAITAMSRLPSASIGTIHSFCTRLLREHALEAGLSPGFSVLVGDDHDDLLNQICRDELLNRLDADPDFKTFCSGAHIIGTGGGFGTSITETVPGLIRQAGSLGISLKNAETMLPDPISAVSRIEFESICKRIRELPKVTPAVKTALDIIEKALAETTDVDALVKRMECLRIKKFGRGGAKAISDDFWALKESVIDAIRYRERFPAAKAFARYVQAVATQFQQRKHEMDTVDFDDQLQMAEALLASGKAKPEFQYVIVDEVQDTSRIQCQLIQSLWGNETNLVICGDKKQSIYTWRGADPQVMPDLEKAILESEHCKLENLQTSYRSKAPILDVINALFESVYGQDDYAAGDRLSPNSVFKTPDEKPCVEFLASDDDEERSKQEKVAAEMDAVAHRIQLLVNGSNDWKPRFRYSEDFEATSDSNAYRYSDVLILLRRTTHQSALEHALRHAGIPYTLGGKGRGLFTRQETRDVSLFLNVITNPKNAYSLVGILRSPWIGLSDEAIAELAWSKEGFSVDQLLGHFSSTGSQPMKHGQGARATIVRYRALLGTKLASELVRLLIEETGYDALLAGLPRGTQRLANLRKVLDWLREAERGAQTTPASVARKLAEQIANPPNVPEAALLDPAQNAVTIMTVHGSKGLTKRVVFLPDISSSPNTDRGFARVFFDKKNAPMLGLKITAPDKSSVASPGFKMANNHAKKVRDHELKNLFYVAMTRARDLVVTSATVGKNPAGWLKELEPLIGSSIPAIPYTNLIQAAELTEPETRQLPSVEHLAAALESLPSAPAQPSLQRIPATRLAQEQNKLEPVFDSETNVQSMKNASAMGSLGHAVLEQLALNGWKGSVKDWLLALHIDFGLSQTESLKLDDRIEQTRGMMIGLTTHMEKIHPEFPFVLHEEDKLIDGTIDLLCRTADGFAIFDYKFTEASDEEVANQYQVQMQLYRKAAEKLYPLHAESSTQLVIVSSSNPHLISID